MPRRLSTLSGGSVPISGTAMFSESVTDTDITISGERFLISGEIETNTSNFDQSIFTTVDAINETIQTPTLSGTIRNIVLGGGLYVASAGDEISTSADGITWTAPLSILGGEMIFDLGFGSGLFIACGSAGGLSTSPDGVAWTPRTSDLGLDNLTAIGFGLNLYVIGSSGARIQTSSDGITWTERTTTFTGLINGITASSTLLVAVADDGEMETSPDGVNWTSRNAQFAGADIDGVQFGDGLFIAIGGSLGKLTRSNDGINWSALDNGIVGSEVIDIDYGGSLFFVTADDGKISTSQNGDKWLEKTTSSSDRIEGVASTSTFAVVVGQVATTLTFDIENYAGTQLSYSEFGENQYTRIS